MPSPGSGPGRNYHDGVDVDEGTVSEMDDVWTIVMMVLVGVPLFLGLRYLATKRAIDRARRRQSGR